MPLTAFQREVARLLAAHRLARLPEEELGCVYLDPQNDRVTPDPDSPTFAGLKRHFGSVRGAWPKIA